MPKKPRGEQFGEGLEVEYSPGDLRLVIQPPVVDFRFRIRSTFPLVLMAIGTISIVVVFWLAPVSFPGGGTLFSFNGFFWHAWFFLFWFVLIRTLLDRSYRTPSEVRFTKSALISAQYKKCRKHGICIHVRQFLTNKRISLRSDELHDFRVQPYGIEALPDRDRDVRIYGDGDWELRVWTDKLDFVVNLPTHIDRLDRLVTMIGEVFGRECRVVEIAGEPNELESDTDNPLRARLSEKPRIQ